MESQTVLGLYEQVLALTRGMLDAAQCSDWDALVRLERERASLVDRITAHDPDPGRDPAGRERKRAIIREIVQTDDQIQVLTQDWMHELREVLGSIGAERQAPRNLDP